MVCSVFVHICLAHKPDIFRCANDIHVMLSFCAHTVCLAHKPNIFCCTHAMQYAWYAHFLCAYVWLMTRYIPLHQRYPCYTQFLCTYVRLINQTYTAAPSPTLCMLCWVLCTYVWLINQTYTIAPMQCMLCWVFMHISLAHKPNIYRCTHAMHVMLSFYAHRSGS